MNSHVAPADSLAENAQESLQEVDGASGVDKGAKRRVAIVLGYLGTKYWGSQYSSKHPTIDGVLEDALFRVGCIAPSNHLQFSKLKWCSSSRTDKGVHAASMVVSTNIRVPKDALEVLPPSTPHNQGTPATTIRKEYTEELVQRLNMSLPSDVRSFAITRQRKAFAAREVCNYRRYEYLLPAAVLTWSAEANDARWRRVQEQAEASGDASGWESVDVFEEGGGEVDLDRLGGIMKMFEGSYNWHNYTSKARQELKKRRKDAEWRRKVRQMVALAKQAEAVEAAGGNVEEMLLQIQGKDQAKDQLKGQGKAQEKDQTDGGVDRQEEELEEEEEEGENDEAGKDEENAMEIAFVDDAPQEYDKQKDGGKKGVEEEEEDAVEGEEERRRRRVREELGEIKAQGTLHRFLFRTLYHSECVGLVEVDGKKFVKLRIGGQSFVLKQIRCIIGMAIAVYMGYVPASVVPLTLDSALDIPVPVAPATFLLLESVDFDVDDRHQRGPPQVVLDPEEREATVRFKESVIYPHIAAMAQDRTVSYFLKFMSEYRIDPPTLDRINAAHDAWLAKVQAVREERKAQRASVADNAEPSGGGSSLDVGRRSSGGGRSQERLLPRGLVTAICSRFGITPGADARAVRAYLLSLIRSGKLPPCPEVDTCVERVTADGLQHCIAVGSKLNAAQ